MRMLFNEAYFRVEVILRCCEVTSGNSCYVKLCSALNPHSPFRSQYSYFNDNVENLAVHQDDMYIAGS